MGPNLTAAEGFILGVGAKMFTISLVFYSRKGKFTIAVF